MSTAPVDPVDSVHPVVTIDPDAPAATPHLKSARYVIVAGWVLFVVSLFLPLANEDLGIKALGYSLIFPLFIFDRLDLELLWLASYGLVNIGLIASLFMAYNARIISHVRSSIFFSLAAVDTMFGPLVDKDIARHPAVYCWAASAILIALGMNMARLRQQKHAAASAPALPPESAQGKADLDKSSNGPT